MNKTTVNNVLDEGIEKIKMAISEYVNGIDYLNKIAVRVEKGSFADYIAFFGNVKPEATMEEKKKMVSEKLADWKNKKAECEEKIKDLQSAKKLVENHQS